jgi:hypothetical protein
MKKIDLIVIYCLLMTILLISGAPALQAQDLFGLDVINTNPFACGKQHHVQWVNDIGDLKIYQSQLWVGMYPGNVSDVGYQVHRVSDSSLLYRGNWDHYADPTGLDGQLHHLNFTPNYITLKEGDALELWYKCQRAGDIAHIIVTVWFTK